MLPILSKENLNEIKNADIDLNEEQKQEFASLFSNILKTVIHNETNKESKAAKNLITEPNEEEKEMEKEKAVKITTKKKLSLITKRNQDEIEQKKEYLEPLDKLRIYLLDSNIKLCFYAIRVADIILDDLIHEVSDELDAFCCQVVDILIESETNL